MYIQKNEDFIDIQELTFDEVDLVVGGDGKKKEAPTKKTKQDTVTVSEVLGVGAALTGGTAVALALVASPILAPAVAVAGATAAVFALGSAAVALVE